MAAEIVEGQPGVGTNARWKLLAESQEVVATPSKKAIPSRARSPPCSLKNSSTATNSISQTPIGGKQISSAGAGQGVVWTL